MKYESPAGFGTGELFQIFRDGRPRTRSELGEATGLSRSTIGLRLDTLLELGIVSPVTFAASTGGRPSSQVAMNAQARVVAAADLGATHATVALTDLAGVILGETRTALSIASGPETVLGWLTQSIGELLADVRRLPTELSAIGIGLPGPVEHLSGRPSRPPIMPGWDNFDVPSWIQETYDAPVLVDNDVNIMALGEQSTNWPEAEHFLFVKVATGIGSGIISGGMLQRGADGIAGDIGHIPVSNGTGVTCHCGNLGCLEAVAGGPAIVATLRTHGLNVTSGADVVKLVEAGDLTAIHTVRQAGRDIGEVLSMCVSVINPSVIIIGGSMAQAGEHLVAGIREVVYARSMPLATQHLTISESQSGPRSAVIGASIMAIEHVLTPESIKAMTAK